MRRVAFISITVVVAAALLWFFPLFRVVPMGQAESSLPSESFQAAKFARQFWDEQLMSALDGAADATLVLTAIREDSVKARKQFGRSAGLGRTFYYFLRGRGVIVSVEKDRIGVSLDNAAVEPDLVLRTGRLFGNAVRDATGLLDPSDFANLQQFNDISTELNRIVETTIGDSLNRQAGPGRKCDFVGCAEVRSDRDLRPLALVPIHVRFE